ncbi:MAG: lactonase family protein [Flavisolibacter sp.]
MKGFIWFILMVIFTSCSSKKQYMLVGTYTSGKSTGIYVYEFDSKEQTAKLVDSVASSNPSYLAVSPNQDFIYAVNENDAGSGGGKVTAFSFDKGNGEITELNQQGTLGDHPCYVTVDATGKWVIAGNYSSGSISVLQANEDGSLSNRVSVIQHTGQGKDSNRQRSPHVHATVLSPDNNFLFVPDLGIDKVMVYSFDAKAGVLNPTSDTAWVQDGSGPRHFTFHPSGNYAYLIQELSGTVTAFKYVDGRLEAIQITSTMPADYRGGFSSADIHVSPDGKFLYASNRDPSNTIAIFKIEETSGKITLVGHQSTLGKTPRNFSIHPSGDFLLVANQNSDSIVIFSINKETGLLTDTGKRIDVGNPVCIKWIEE